MELSSKSNNPTNRYHGETMIESRWGKKSTMIRREEDKLTRTTTSTGSSVGERLSN